MYWKERIPMFQKRVGWELKSHRLQKLQAAELPPQRTIRICLQACYWSSRHLWLHNQNPLMQHPLKRVGRNHLVSTTLTFMSLLTHSFWHVALIFGISFSVECMAWFLSVTKKWVALISVVFLWPLDNELSCQMLEIVQYSWHLEEGNQLESDVVSHCTGRPCLALVSRVFGEGWVRLQLVMRKH